MGGMEMEMAGVTVLVSSLARLEAALAIRNESLMWNSSCWGVV